jgi:hypothetical protein
LFGLFEIMTCCIVNNCENSFRFSGNNSKFNSGNSRLHRLGASRSASVEALSNRSRSHNISNRFKDSEVVVAVAVALEASRTSVAAVAVAVEVAVVAAVEVAVAAA